MVLAKTIPNAKAIIVRSGTRWCDAMPVNPYNNTDMWGIIMEPVSNEEYAAFISKKIWCSIHIVACKTEV